MNCMNYKIRSAPKNPLYAVYKNMKQRCLNKNNPAFHNYGQRGIHICNEWLDDFDTFRNWAITHGYDPSLTIERIDNDGNYEPSNCMWADRYTQSRNKRCNKKVTINGETKVLKDWCKSKDISLSTVQERLKRKWSYESALSEPIKGHNIPHNITFNGKTQSLSAWSREVGIPRSTIRQGIMLGWSIDRALKERPHNNGRKLA